MSILASELKWLKPTEISDSGSNGGRMTFNESIDSLKGNVFEDVSQAERTAGSTKHRKMFIQVDNSENLTLISPKVFVETRTPGEDRVTFFAGTQSDIQSDILGTEQEYGSGILNASITAGDTSIDVELEDETMDIFIATMVIRISDKQTIDGAGNEEFNTIQSVSNVGNIFTLVLDNQVQNNYVASTPTKIASVYEPGNINAAYVNFIVTSTAGTFDDSTYPVLLYNEGTLQQSWTLTFSSATNYSISGDIVGSVGSGTVSSNFSPTNPETGQAYFTINALGFGGTYQSGDTIVFDTSPASIPIWYKRIVPAGAASLSGNSVIVGVIGESS